MTKQCSKCLKEKEVSEFNKKASVKNGYMSECRDCNKIRRHENKEHIKQYNINYNKTHKELIREYKKQWKLKHFETDIYSIKYLKLKGLHNIIVGFSILRKHVLKRDLYTCQLCKTTKKLQVHHILPIQYDAQHKKVFDPYNLITLCKDCHLLAHNGNFRTVNTELAEYLSFTVVKNELNIAI